VYSSDLPPRQLYIYESDLAEARKLTKTSAYRTSQIMRKRVEELFGEAKECMGLRRMKFRGALFVREQVLLTAAAQNIKRMARLLWRIGPKRKAAILGEYAVKFLRSFSRYFPRVFPSLVGKPATTWSHSLVFQQPVKT
jgi:hypothetical protein